MPERSYAWSEVPHLAKRTLWSLRKPTPDAADERWLLGVLTPAEGLLYRSMSAVDRSHALGCARHVDDADRDVIVASALHDVGKVEAGLGTPGRVMATLCGLGVAERANGWGAKSGLRRQIAIYLDHAERGAAALARAGAPQLAIVWAKEHHLSPEEWSIDRDLGERLAEADDLVEG